MTIMSTDNVSLISVSGVRIKESERRSRVNIPNYNIINTTGTRGNTIRELKLNVSMQSPPKKFKTIAPNE